MSTPDKNGWIEWSGGIGMPGALAGRTAYVQFRADRENIWTDNPGRLRWSHTGEPGDIVGYKIGTAIEVASLHAQPERDGFTHESPIRAFTHWTVNGRYAIGKGFRPSLQHLTVYLDAMERLEGWALLQILEAASGSPSFVFRRPAAGCVNHPNRPIRENLDGDDLCQECCDNWARGEGDFRQ